MSRWSRQRQVTITFIILIVLTVLIGAGAWYWWPVPSCTDGTKNQNEVGIDCGGVCPKICATSVVPLKVLWSRVFPARSGEWYVVAQVQNQNRNVGARQVNYELKLLDAIGGVLARRGGETFINPGETALILETNIPVSGNRVPSRALVTITPPTWEKPVKEVPIFSTNRKSFINDPAPRLVAAITNPSITDYTDIEVSIVVAGNDENVFAASRTLVDRLTRGESRDIYFTWPMPFVEAPAVVTILPRLSAYRP
ncbi:MAG: hypothetical protein HYV76_00880 [Candidatus Vogelbacteria bacterium]|nr:hypothetical protein [Candidatus Vogelbacteria bacterium]